MTAPESDGDSWVALGAIARPHGVRGELRVHSFNPSSAILLQEGWFALRSDDPEEEMFRVLVTSAKRAPKYIRWTIDEVDSLEAADDLRGLEICIPREALPKLEEGEYYLHDLVGLEVRSGEATGEATIVGKVSSIMNYPTTDCLRIILANANFIEIPVTQPWFVSADLEAGVVWVDNVEDLPVEKAKKKRTRRKKKSKGDEKARTAERPETDQSETQEGAE